MKKTSNKKPIPKQILKQLKAALKKADFENPLCIWCEKPNCKKSHKREERDEK